MNHNVDTTGIIKAIKVMCKTVGNPHCDEATAELVKSMLFHYCNKVSNEIQRMKMEGNGEGDTNQRVKNACLEALVTKTVDSDEQVGED